MKKITSVLFLFYCFSVGWAQTVPPCTLEITDAETFARDWTVIDVNSDVSANTWAYNDGNAMYTQDKSNAADDWLIAPRSKINLFIEDSIIVIYIQILPNTLRIGYIHGS